MFYNKYFIVISSIILFVIIGLIWYVSYLNKIIAYKDDVIQIQKQNESAMIDQIKMKADSIQDFSLYTKNLQLDNDDLQNKNLLLKSKYMLLMDSIKILNQHTDVDTSGNTVIVNFEGQKGKVYYNGNTTYFKSTSIGTYSIVINVTPSKIHSNIYISKNDNIIRNEIYVDGSLINDAETIIDSSLYNLIQNGNLVDIYEPGFFDNIHLFGEIQQNLVKNNGVYITDKFSTNIGIQYNMYPLYMLGKYDILNHNIQVGIQYHISVKDIWLLIF